MELKNKQDNVRHILLADDDSSDRFFFGKALKEIPFHTKLTTTENGEQLMKILKKESAELPDVIFLDLNMPRKTGSECLIEIKQDERLKGIPIIIYSTSVHEEIAEILYANGANYFLKKCSLDELPAYISKLLSLLDESTAQPLINNFIINTSPVKI